MRVLLEPTSKGWRATSLDLLNLFAEEASEAMALERLRDKAMERFLQGAKIVDLSLGKNDVLHPASEFAGALKDDPLFEEWQKGIEEYRKLQEDFRF